MGRLTDLFAGRTVAAHVERAQRRMAAGRLDDAARVVERGLEKFPTSATLRDLSLSIRRAQAHKPMRRLETRIEVRSDPLAYEELVKLYVTLELPDEARRKARAFAEAHPGLDTPHLLLGELELNRYLDELQTRHGHSAHDHLVHSATLNGMSIQARLLLAELYFCVGAQRSLAILLENLRQIAPETGEMEQVFAVMEEAGDPNADERLDGLFERIEVSGELARDPGDWPLSKRRGGVQQCSEEAIDPIAWAFVSEGTFDELVLLRRDGTVLTHASPLGMSADGEIQPSDTESGFVQVVRTVGRNVFQQAGEFDMGNFKRCTIRGVFGNIVVGRVGSLMVGARAASTMEPLRMWEYVSSRLEPVAGGRAA